MGNERDSIAKKLGQMVKDAGDAIGTAANQAASSVSTFATDISAKAGSAATDVRNQVFHAMDVNGDGQVNIEDVIIMGLRTPGVKIKRDAFLRKELSCGFSSDMADAAIEATPANAGITVEEIDRIADSVIQFERICVSGISTALGAPGGMAIAATLPADIVQYYGYMLRTAQKLMYLYGFPEIGLDENQQALDSATMNTLILCLGVMFGAAGANQAIKSLAKALATGVEKQLLKTALTKTTFYPIVKSVAKWFGVKMTKDVFAGFFKKAIPIVGGVIGGGLTFLSFGSCCDRLKTTLRETKLSDPTIQTDDDMLIINDEYCNEGNDEDI